MAENAANFTFTSHNKPSIFEVIAQKSLNDTLHPALQKIALFLATNCPQKFNWLGKYYDEVFLILNCGLQFGYLRQYDATFSENFYGLKRILDNNNQLSNHHRRISLLFTVLLPYFKRKLDDKVALYRLEQADGCLRNNFEGHFKKLLILSHSAFEIAWGLLTVYNYIKYMSNRTEAQLPILHLIDLKFTYSEPVQEASFWSAVFKGQFRDLWKINLLRNAVTTSFEIAAFFLQFLHTWNAHQASYSITALPGVKAPSGDGKARNYLNKCPICLQHWKIPTVLPVSGYVFCFPCILRFLRENQRCPVTNLPAKPLDIVRLYDE
ncbi:peroxisome assembly protein 12 [Asbolus verrucosus]|uniref:Peroxisome assembly protein 12 n=1 Tax=Asbolus verrucosus TaxID=1661398 RepID=A0A482VPY9_ASBVE|nr:peroxisome assembly protein 12 [Asbolus verrucosus]